MSFWWKSKEMREGVHKNIREKQSVEKSTCTKALGQETVYKHLMSTNRSQDIER